ncbi:MAG: HD domain-containing protein [Candidatus Omnitrophica bacterium]|nr:HD domain-containing protein [Candidatus Omnitrophota bacterium]
MRGRPGKISARAALDFICEAGALKQTRRSGWQVLGIKNAESVADHSFRCAVIGYVLAHMEKADPYKVILMTLFGDMPEARITDLHKMAHSYLDVRKAEDKSFSDQIKGLPDSMRRQLTSIHTEFRRQKSRESIVSRDADILECLIQAKEYHEQGHLKADKFTRKAPTFLKSKSARLLWQLAKKSSLTDWWIKLSRFKR